MEIFPSDTQLVDPDKYLRRLIRSASGEDKPGYLLLNINPTVIPGDSLHALIVPRGAVFCKYFPLDNGAMFEAFVTGYRQGLYNNTVRIIGNKLLSNTALRVEDGRLSLAFSYALIFPKLNRSDTNPLGMNGELRAFCEDYCVFADDIPDRNTDYCEVLGRLLEKPSFDCAADRLTVSENNINAIIQLIAPEYTIVRFAPPAQNVTEAGASEEMLVVDRNDLAVRAYRLEPEQINIVNRMRKGEQLILACAGSGKSVLIIAKCFKAARMNPDKRFLITCFNRNLQSMFEWYIDRAGLRQRNIDCLTFDSLCYKLIRDNRLRRPEGKDVVQQRRDIVIKNFYSGHIANRYYGIFIDEVQMFEQNWYKLCFDMLRNRDTDDHIFIISGDKTQELKKRQRGGRAPWNAGENYPSYRGKSIRINKNFRNCIQINNYIDRFIQASRELITRYYPDDVPDPDLFLRGQAYRDGEGVRVIDFDGNARNEAEKIVASIKYFHDEKHIPYDEIAVTMFNTKYTPLGYFLENELINILTRERIPYIILHNSNDLRAACFGSGGVSLLTFESVLGLDYEAVIVCGIKPLGAYDNTKTLSDDISLDEDGANLLKKNISYLYVACTRARNMLHILIGSDDEQTLYGKLLKESLLIHN